jgi:hypothetical protein
MDSASAEATTDQLKLGLVRRIMVLLFGCVASAVLLGLLPLLYLAPTTVEVATRTRPAQDAPPIGAVVTPVVALALLGLIAYGVYDAVRMSMRLRSRQREEQQMFP